MARQWVKKEVRHDPLVSFAAGAEAFVRKDTQKALLIVAGVCGAAVLAWLLISAHVKNRNDAYSALMRAETNIHANPNMTLGLCDKIISEQQHSSKTRALAQYIKGDALYVKEDYEGAFKLYSEAMPGISEELKPNVLYALAKSKESLGKYAEALSFYQEFTVDYDRHYLSPEVYLSMARILSVSGESAEAAAYIEIIKGRFQGTKWSSYAENLLPTPKK
ncbi:tetratricopeptide repeat protein [bacterium]|nr:tetratricopeptide repeat protein [bacterium]